MLPQLCPSYHGGITTKNTSDPEVLRAETNPVQLLGDSRQKQPLRAVTWMQRKVAGRIRGGLRGNQSTKLRRSGRRRRERGLRRRHS
ncbi:hypothetical protein NDU88_007056 [Pleurodeles waltl]|uniref:Uncharacterized protein n=1 Tax=Pleurodeles waltl TaxID=8319 RepID=A0AAV7RTN5_PLEWA|nr:hypothetical protein NDU88_007056 [Pleurodeles waltl]